MRVVATALIPLLTISSAFAQDVDPDRDGDGLSDFQEVHKYLTDPDSADSDGDGIPDGDWRERREYQYTVRSVVHVMKPVTPQFLNDDYQDARVLDETEDYVELEVIHYPFNTVASAIAPDPQWRRTAEGMEEWLTPGPTSDWTPGMANDLGSALKKDGVDVTKLDDVELVKQASRWLVEHAEYHDGFSTFVTAFDEKGRPFVPEELRGDKSKAELEHQWEREISARGMLEHGQRGSCTSSAIYLSGCLRALGIPTRTVLCIPLIDASDERERELVAKLQHHGVRKTLKAVAGRLRGSWASHTFNEVWVGGRWRRLNYDRLGQDVWDPGLFGLMTHVATFRDWADANMPATVGRRQALHLQNDVFGGPNPYSTISLRDEFGVHCELENPRAEAERLAVAALYWTDSADLPEDIRAGLGPRGRWGLVACFENLSGSNAFRDFVNASDQRVYLEAPGHPRLGIGFDPGCWWYDDGRAWLYVPFGGGDRRDLVRDVPYVFRPRNQKDGYRWVVPEELRVVRKEVVPR